MIVNEHHVANVVTEVSAGAEDPQHVASLVGAFMQLQPTVGHYVSAHSNELGLEGVVLTLLHASVLARAVELARGRRLRLVRFEDLDAAKSGVDAGVARRRRAGAGRLPRGQPHPEDPTIGGGQRDVALRVLAVVAQAYSGGADDGQSLGDLVAKAVVSLARSTRASPASVARARRGRARPGAVACWSLIRQRRRAWRPTASPGAIEFKTMSEAAERRQARASSPASERRAAKRCRSRQARNLRAAPTCANVT